VGCDRRNYIQPKLSSYELSLAMFFVAAHIKMITAFICVKKCQVWLIAS